MENKKGKILAVSISKNKGTIKTPQDSITVKPDLGIVGDAHSGPGIRQVSFLAKESHNAFQPQTKVQLKNGIFAENITTQGLYPLNTIPIGTKIKAGTALLEVSKIGKECHSGCAISKIAGECIMPKECIFCIVLEEGEIKPNDDIEIL